MFTVLSNSKKLNLPADIQLDLYDKLVLPILTYGSEIWGYSNVKGIETVQTEFVKYVLHVNKSTPNIYKFIQLFEQSSTNKRLLVKLCRFLKEILKMTNG